jgi:hypothetical protein
MSTKKETERSSTVYDDKREVRTGLSDQNEGLDLTIEAFCISTTEIGEISLDILIMISFLHGY